MTATSIHDLESIDQSARTLRIDPHQIKRFRLQYYKRSAALHEALTEINPHHRAAFTERIQPPTLKIVEQFKSNQDGATRIIFKLKRTQQLIETVILRHEKGRTTLCVSSQVGCAAACTFCATGAMQLQGNLTQSEILDQLIIANQILKSENRGIRNLVFMGMGEPFHNENAIHDSINILQSPLCFDLTPARILVSTVGIPAAMLRFAEQFPAVGLALSLHSARPEIRAAIIPLATKYSLEELHQTIQQINTLQPQRSVMIEYLMLQNINDSPTDADALITFLSGIKVHLNLIPYNPIESAPDLTASTPDSIQAFAVTLRAANIPTTIRHSLGTDIAAACGQLIRQHSFQEK